MPNGGLDNCVTCWFNSENEGVAPTSHEEWSHARVVNCTIRGLEIDFPIDTYCANHPYHNLGGIKVPIGPVYRSDGRERRLWKPSPDNEEIRAVLLDQLRNMEETPRFEYSSGMAFDEEVILQVMRFRDLRAAPYLRRIARFDPLA